MEDLTYDCNNWTVPVNLSTHPVGPPSQGLTKDGTTPVNTLEVQVWISILHLPIQLSKDEFVSSMGAIIDL